MNERSERLVKIEVTHITECLTEETCIEKVHRRVLRTADVLVDRAHLIDEFSVERFLIVLVIRVTELIPGRINEGIHGIRITLCGSAALRTCGVHELVALRKRRFSIRTEFYVVGEKYRELIIRYRNDAALFAVNDRDRCSPVTLTGDQPVTKSVVDLSFRHALRLEFFDDRIDRRLEVQTIELAAVYQYAFFDEGKLIFGVRARCDNSLDREIELLGELIVSFVVCRNGHDHTGTIGSDYIIGSPDRYFLSGDRVDRVRSCEYTGLFTCGGHSVDIGSLFGESLILFDFFSALICCKECAKRRFRCDNYVGHTHQGICTGGEYRKLQIGSVFVL